ncbi:MAG: hypothetical protein EBY35_02020 [Rhodobacteraceae bacterium]|jgi:hypothetical protein|nr:hypothetical protein [Paracoccaceae bacterium]
MRNAEKMDALRKDHISIDTRANGTEAQFFPKGALLPCHRKFATFTGGICPRYNKMIKKKNILRFLFRMFRFWV